jgi:uncharacterized protein
MPYQFLAHDAFLDRKNELTALERWWADDSLRFPLILYGRRRTGKSWLTREFAHGKEADVFVCDERAEQDQLDSFSDVLGQRLDVRPRFADPRDFFRALFRLAATEKRLAVIDEFPLLLAQRTAADSVLAALMEDELPRSRLRLILCGSQVATMEELLAERRPLHGRGQPMLLTPLRFPEARVHLGNHGGADLIERYAIAGGMPLYLARLGRPRSLQAIVCEDILAPLGPLFDEPRAVLHMELTNTGTHFSILRALAGAPDLDWEALVRESRVEASTVSRAIDRLIDLHLVDAANPLFADARSRRRRYRLSDRLMRFWFRFVFSRQGDLRAGLDPWRYWDTVVSKALPEHVAPVFEDVCRSWVWSALPLQVETVGRWWGLARHDLRASGQRMSEEIDVVGALGHRVTVVGECKWQARPMDRGPLQALRAFKLPALAQTGVDISGAQVVLFSRGGFTPDLREEAAQSNVTLVDVEDLLRTLSPTWG